MTKGITPVIALVMLMLITVGVVGLAYAWFSGLTSSQTEKGISIPPGGAYCYIAPAATIAGAKTDAVISVLIQNNGATSSITRSDIVAARIDGSDCTTAQLEDIDGANAIAAGGGKKILLSYKCTAHPTCDVDGGCPIGKYAVVVGTRTNVISTTVECKQTGA
ncbi:MAG: hypothetical protein HY516_01540 [Candidatus Aenigmarchaeota archaeon]|nr:hypothetical protein [Candidatus Aenigmarchaeota archaeon]